MAHVEGKVTSYAVIGHALNDGPRVAKGDAQSIEIATWKLLMERPKDVAIGYPMWKTLQKLPKEKLEQLPDSVKEQFAKFEKAGVAATTAVFTMSAPRVAPPGESVVAGKKDDLMKTLQGNVQTAKAGPERNGNGPTC